MKTKIKSTQYSLKYTYHETRWTIRKGVRGVEIRKFIYRYLLKGKNYESMVILDDRDDMEEFTRYLVQTDPYQGITEEIANRAIKVLNDEI